MNERQTAIGMMMTRFVQKEELMAVLHMSDRSVRALVQDIKLDYPVISTSNVKGYKIATSDADLGLVEDALRNNRAKALSIFEGQKKLREFRDGHMKSGYEQLELNF